MSKRVTRYGMLIALAMILSYVEVLIPVYIAVYGIKLGLANLVVVIALYLDGAKGATMVSLVRILLVGMTFGNFSNMIYSLAGGGLSLFVMIIGQKTGVFSKVGVSITGGVFHNIGQLFVAATVVESLSVMVYLPVLLIAGAVTGAVIGVLADRILPIIKRAGLR